MNEEISLLEAATFLGVSKQTLRNWDKAGKLKPQRDPRNGYRIYHFDDLQSVKDEQANYEVRPESNDIALAKNSDDLSPADDLFTIRRQLGRLHNILRDTASNSSIIERFDEIAKLLFLRALSEQGHLPSDLFSQLLESQAVHAAKLRKAYDQACQTFGKLIPEGFRHIKLPDATLVLVSPIVEKLPISSSRLDVKGLAFEEVIRNTFEKGDNQQFFTPGVVTEFIVGMLGERVGTLVCDPACGTGGFLVEILKQRRPIKHITGLEIDRRLFWTTGLNLLVHGGQSFTVHTLDGSGSLGDPGLRFVESFDTIVTNPPFGSDLTDQASLRHFTLGKGFPSRRRGILFIEQCLTMLRPGGRLAIIIDEGVLSLPSAADVRSFILNNFHIEAIVALPESAFMPYATVSTSILFIKKEKLARQKPTFFAKAVHVGRKANGDPDYIYEDSGERHLNNDLPHIIESWNSFLKTGRIDATEIQAFSTDLIASTTTDDNRIDFQYHHPSRFDAIRSLEKSTSPIMSLFEFCSERRESIIPRTEATTPTLRFTGLANIESYTGRAVQIDTPSASLKSAVKKYYPGDILFARMRPNLRKCHFVRFANPGFTSAECVVLTPRTDSDGNALIDPDLLTVLLRSDLVYGQIIHKVAGIGRPRISVKDLRQVKIPVPILEKQRVLVETYHQQLKAADALRQEAQALLDEAEAVLAGAVKSLTSGIAK